MTVLIAWGALTAAAVFALWVVGTVRERNVRRHRADRRGYDEEEMAA